MFNNYKEIVTKTIIGKGKKTFKNDYEIIANNKVDTVLGCWVINHHIKGKKEGEYIRINGNYDVNIWYSYDNNTKTDVVNSNVTYEEKVRVRVRDNEDDYDIIIDEDAVGEEIDKNVNTNYLEDSEKNIVKE